MKTRLPALAALCLLALAACSDRADITAARAGPLRPALSIQAGEVCDGVSTPLVQCQVLVLLYNETGGENWSLATNWGANTNPCTWYGVECTNGDSGAIQTLNLAENNLTGEIPPELVNLTSLVTLRLAANHLSGTLQHKFALLTKLEVLDVGFNDLTGPVPPALDQHPSLVELKAEFNHLTGSIPPQLGNLPALRSLHLGHNELTGSIPPRLANAPLAELDLARNELSGAIPPELGGLGDLELLTLHGNQLTGSIPPELGGLTNLEILSLNDNLLTGPIPSELGGLTALQFLALADNQLSGTIPDALGGLTELTSLSLEANQLSGLLPLSLAIVGDPLQQSCRVVPGNEGLFMPDLEAWRDADQDEDGQICGLGFSTAEDIGDDAVDEIDDLVPETLNPGQANALTTKIEHAQAKAAAGHYATAINMLQAFLQQLGQLVSDGTLTAEQAAPFQQQAEALIQIWTQML